MSLFGRLRDWISHVLGGSDEPTPTPPPEGPIWDTPSPPPEGPDEGDIRGGSELPPGWVLVGLYHQGEPTTRINATGVTDVTDSEIHRADALIVQYVPGGEDGYRWVHGARDWRSLADQIERVIVVVSPAAE